MIIETLLREALATGLGLLSEAGFEDEVIELLPRLTMDGDAATRQAFMKAWEEVQACLEEDVLALLLDHPPFQEAVVSGLLDPVEGFAVDAAAEVLGEGYGGAVRRLRRFFATLSSKLEDDANWGPLLEHYQTLKWREDVQEALQARHWDVPEADVIGRVSPLGCEHDSVGNHY